MLKSLKFLGKAAAVLSTLAVGPHAGSQFFKVVAKEYNQYEANTSGTAEDNQNLAAYLSEASRSNGAKTAPFVKPQEQPLSVAK